MNDDGFVKIEYVDGRQEVYLACDDVEYKVKDVVCVVRLNKDKQLHGVSEFYNDEDNLESLLNYHSGKLHGECIDFDDDGGEDGVSWWWHGVEVTEEEWRKNELIERLAGLDGVSI